MAPGLRRRRGVCGGAGGWGLSGDCLGTTRYLGSLGPGGEKTVVGGGVFTPAMFEMRLLQKSLLKKNTRAFSETPLNPQTH